MHPTDPRHGTISGYHYCRCADCREAWRIYVTGRRRRQGMRPNEVYQAERKTRAAARLTLHGDPVQALARRAEALQAARNAATGELAQVVHEQAVDDRYGHRVRSPWVSLDARDVFGHELYETLQVAA